MTTIKLTEIHKLCALETGDHLVDQPSSCGVHGVNEQKKIPHNLPTPGDVVGQGLAAALQNPQWVSQGLTRFPQATPSQYQEGQRH